MRSDVPSFKLVCAMFAVSAASAFAQQQQLTLEQIMADPDWIGNAPERPYWAEDSDSIYYHRKPEGEDERDLIELTLRGREKRVVSDSELGDADAPGGDYSADYSRKVYERSGDIFVRYIRSGNVVQLTRSESREHSPVYLRDRDRVSYRRGDQLYVRDLASGAEEQPAVLRLEKDPAEEDDDFLTEQQLRLFDTVQEKRQKRDEARERDAAARMEDNTRAPPAWYLGDKIAVQTMYLSPDERFLLLVTRPKKGNKDGKKGSMPNYVTESGYTTTRETRARVGTDKRPSDELLLLDLVNRERHAIALDGLPGIMDDPLETLKSSRDDAKDDSDEVEEEKPDARPVTVRSVAWNRTGDTALIQLTTHDRKDRWIVTLNAPEAALRSRFRETDSAWINRRFTQAGWLRDGETIWFVSETSGYAHLYRLGAKDDIPVPLTDGDYEISFPVLTRDGRHFYFRANRTHPGVYEVFRISSAGGEVEQITFLGGGLRFELSPNERHLLLLHSKRTEPPEIYVQRARPNAEPRRLTRTVSKAFSSIAWTEPEIVSIPSNNGRPVHARLYLPSERDDANTRPAVVFVHGAGYLQNAHFGWSSYFREFMFHSLLTQRGYVVLDMDYRASAGYGRDWRTAIYRQMGTPELEDLRDGVTWLVENANVDRERIGVYGGSYGGFLTLMALFREPDLFACGAALRPVTDWAHYNDGYTANILNVPAIDPDSYANSSPIEFAQGLEKPLLICHGMQDNNVFFQDSVRLAQRLIELKKEDWEFAVYPVEPHGFREDTSWLDEYRRIFKLFEDHL